MILPWLIQILLAVVGLAVSLAAVCAVCYVAFELLGDLIGEEEDE